MRALTKLGMKSGPIKGAAAKALNDAAKEVQKDAGARIKKQAGSALTLAGAKSGMKLRRAWKGNLMASVELHGKPLPLKAFSKRAIKLRGTTVNTTLFGKHVRGTDVFQAPGKAKRLNKHYYKRDRKLRTPRRARNPKGAGSRKDPRNLSKFYGPPLATLWTQDAFKKADAIARSEFIGRFNYHLNRELRKWRRGL